MTPLMFQCPECQEPLIEGEDRLSCRQGHVFPIQNGCYRLMPLTVSELTNEEAQYHAQQKGTWVEQNQLNALRNTYFHDAFVTALGNQSVKLGHVLELGGGVGYDLHVFLRVNPNFKAYVFSEVSDELVQHVAAQTSCSRILFCTLDALRIPFADRQFDCVFMVAAFHHLPNLKQAIEEIARVTKSGGIIGFGIEPAGWWLNLLKRTKGLLRVLFPHKDHSAADEEAAGFCAEDFMVLARAHNLRVLQIQPVWLLCGVLHCGLEFLYRLLRLRTRLRVPHVAEKMVIRLDEWLLRMPIVRNWSWHSSVIYQKL